MIDRIDRKREVLVHVAKYCFEGTLEAHKEFIPLEIVPVSYTQLTLPTTERV